MEQVLFGNQCKMMQTSSSQDNRGESTPIPHREAARLASPNQDLSANEKHISLHKSFGHCPLPSATSPGRAGLGLGMGPQLPTQCGCVLYGTGNSQGRACMKGIIKETIQEGST